MFSFGIRAHALNDEHQRVLNIDVSKQVLQVIAKESVESVHALAYILCVVPNIRDSTAFAIYFKNGVAPLKCWAESSKDAVELCDLLSRISVDYFLAAQGACEARCPARVLLHAPEMDVSDCVYV